MAIDNDLSAVLPDPPPPRPARRDAAIEEALRRFDTRGQDRPPSPATVRPARSREGWGRPQIAALASLALVVMVSVPIWWEEKDTLGQVDAPPARPDQANRPLPAETAARPAPPPSAVAEPALARAADAVPAAPADRPVQPDSLPLPALEAQAAAPAPPPPVAAAARVAPAPPPAEAAITVTGSRIARQDYAANSPVVTVDSARPAGGDWNDCTVLDPRRDTAACRGPAARSASGANGEAAEQVASGLSLAWQGHVDRAIAAFSRAVAVAPALPAAYLNRGLAYQSKGDLGRALADFNAAVSRDPNSARGYYHRSRLYRAMGNAERADADAARAIRLDPGYRAVLP